MTRLTGGEWNRREIHAPPGAKTRPTTARVRQSVMARLGERLSGARFLDVFAGSGAMSFEALSRGAAMALAFEQDARTARLIRENARRLGVDSDRLTTLTGDALRLLTVPPPAAFDFAYLDPPYAYDQWAELLERLGAPGWLTPQACALAEHSRRRALDPGPRFRLKDVWEYGDTRISALEPVGTMEVAAL